MLSVNENSATWLYSFCVLYFLLNCPKVESCWQLYWKNNRLTFPKRILQLYHYFICSLSVFSGLRSLRFVKNKKWKAQAQSLRGISEWSTSFGGACLLKVLLRDALVLMKIQSHPRVFQNDWSNVKIPIIGLCLQYCLQDRRHDSHNESVWFSYVFSLPAFYVIGKFLIFVVICPTNSIFDYCGQMTFNLFSDVLPYKIITHFRN